MRVHTHGGGWLEAHNDPGLTIGKEKKKGVVWNLLGVRPPTNIGNEEEEGKKDEFRDLVRHDPQTASG
jgi:hypothetical protein